MSKVFEFKKKSKCSLICAILSFLLCNLFCMKTGRLQQPLRTVGVRQYLIVGWEEWLENGALMRNGKREGKIVKVSIVILQLLMMN